MQYGDYCTQMGPSGSGREACGAATLASCALSNGWQSDPWQLTVQIATTYGILDVGCTTQQLINAAADFNMDGRFWYQWVEAEEALKRGEAVCILHNNHLLVPRPYPTGEGWNATHWIRALVVGEGNTMVYVYDPLCYMYQPSGSVYQGPTLVTQESLWAAIMDTGYPESGAILTSRAGTNLNDAS